MHGKEQRDLMSAVSARSVSHTAGVDRVRALQRVLYRCAKQDQDRRFHALYDKLASSYVLQSAWELVRQNKGAAGIDQQTLVDSAAQGVPEFLAAIAQSLRDKSYRPQPVRRVAIPKAGDPPAPDPSVFPPCATGWCRPR